jgi:hypothetical protein
VSSTKRVKFSVDVPKLGSTVFLLQRAIVDR